ncbi:DNA polymerase family A-domain-containing protein [Gaertneriomyces semiglobifer]|nr:DNA polymerase family A-domain-containing protein [Gaertneriomyces semiglobifer]
MNLAGRCRAHTPIANGQHLARFTSAAFRRTSRLHVRNTFTAPSQSNDSSSHEEAVRRNPIGIQMLPTAIFENIFPAASMPGPLPEQVDLAKAHLDKWGLLGKSLDTIPNVNIPLPKLAGESIGEHFRIIAKEQCEPYAQLAKGLSTYDLPPMPVKWDVTHENWVRYETHGGRVVAVPVPYPGEDAVFFDTEVMFKVSKYPLIAVAASRSNWYSWISPGFLSSGDLAAYRPRNLVPFGRPETQRLIVGHHVSYDRARILEEYRLQPTRFAYLDTMSLHCAFGGLSSQQRPAWRKYKKEQELTRGQMVLAEDVDEHFAKDTTGWHTYGSPKESWQEVSAMNNLQDVAELHLNERPDKSTRDLFSGTDLLTLRKQLQDLMNYCATDVAITQRLFRVLYPKFLEKCPHPASLAGTLHMGKGYLPVSNRWADYVRNAEAIFADYQEQIRSRLVELADDAVEKYKDGGWQADEWLRHLDWEIPKLRMTKEVRGKGGNVLKASRPVKRQGRAHLGKPKWYMDLWDRKSEKVDISLSKRVAPYLLRLSWNGHPLQWCKEFGWMYRVGEGQQGDIAATPVPYSDDMADGHLDDTRTDEQSYVYYRVPHPDGEGKNCGSPLGKSYVSAFETGILTSQYPDARQILDMNVQCAYWAGAKQRVEDQFVVWGTEEFEGNHPSHWGTILPQSIVMGTVTRRAVERTWMTAANAKRNRIGSELKAQVQSPPGYKLVGADVDSEELWIASLLGDAAFGMHGATAIGFMTLQGTKKAGTDMHTVTGRILGISRDNAKIFNYGRIYGAGVKYATQLLVRLTPGMTQDEATIKALDLYSKTKGQRYMGSDPWHIGRKRSIWHGGTESHMFNRLEEIATNEAPKTPVLQCEIPESLLPRYVGKDFMTSRVNWAVQSSGVDYLHLLLVSMDYLIRRLRIDARFVISIHDEVRFLVKDEHQLLVALALQISNLWVRAMFAESVGIADLPMSVAFFSAVDIDHCLRKESDMECLTPSNVTPVPSGRSLDIHALAKELAAWQEKHGIHDLLGPELPSVQQIRLRLISLSNARNAETMTAGREVALLQTKSAEAAKQVADEVLRARIIWLRIQMASNAEELRSSLKAMRLAVNRSQKARREWEAAESSLPNELNSDETRAVTRSAHPPPPKSRRMLRPRTLKPT